MMNEKVSILLVDDHPMIRHGIKALLNDVENLNVNGEASNGQEAIAQFKSGNYDLIIMDIKMPVMDGIEATKELKKIDNAVNILALSMYDEHRFITRMLQAGAKGYILKNTGKEELVSAIAKIIAGENYFSPEVSNIMMSRFMNDKTESPRGSSTANLNVTLTKRETEIIRMIANEMTNSEIAAELNISPRTVDTHRRNLLQKLDVKNTAGLVRYALQNDIIA
ncbi:MAG: response regulator transcription factor [Chitinophagales bacterium]